MPIKNGQEAIRQCHDRYSFPMSRAAPSAARRNLIWISWISGVAGNSACRADLRRAVAAAEELALGLDSMPDDSTAAMFALGGQCMNRTFEAVERVRFAGHHDLKRLVIFVAADFTLLCHFMLPSLGRLKNIHCTQLILCFPEPARHTAPRRHDGPPCDRRRRCWPATGFRGRACKSDAPPDH